MAIKVGGLWKDSRFLNLDNLSKLLYIYLGTNPNLNSVGVICPDGIIMARELKCSIEELRAATKSLVKAGFIRTKLYNKVGYFIIPENFKYIPKTESGVLKVQKDLATLPEELVQFLDSIGISAGAKVSNFVKPTPEEVSNYAKEIGYNVNGKEFVDFYEDTSSRFSKKDVWVDGRGKEVRDWRAKVRKVWCRAENKIAEVKGNPKNGEDLSVEIDGKIYYPDGWRRGKPYSKNFTVDLKLKELYEQRSKNS